MTAMKAKDYLPLSPHPGHSMTNRTVGKADRYHFPISLDPQAIFNLVSSTPLSRIGFYLGQGAAFA
jgi:hypothetical protein